MVNSENGKASTSNTRRICVPRPESVGSGTAVVPQRGRFRGVRADHDRGPRAPSSRILAWCAMRTHWHFVVWPQEEGEVTAYFRWLSHTHAMRWHVAHNTVGRGHLYQGRFKSFPVEEDEHFLTVCRYVERSVDGGSCPPRGGLALGQSLGTASGERGVACDPQRLAAGVSQGLDGAGERSDE